MGFVEICTFAVMAYMTYVIIFKQSPAVADKSNGIVARTVTAVFVVVELAALAVMTYYVFLPPTP